MAETPFLRFLLATACIIIIIAGIKALAGPLTIVLFAVLIAQCIHPLTAWLRKRRISTGLAIFITILVVTIAGVAVISIVGRAAYSIKEKLPEYSSRISELSSGFITELRSRGIDLGAVQSDATNPGKIQHIALSFFAGLASFIGNGVFILIMVVVLLIEFEVISRKVEKEVYPKGSFMYRIRDLNNVSSKFFGIQALLGLMQGTLSTLVLVILGVDFAVMWGVLFFFLNFVPAVGFFLAVIMPTVVAWLELGTTKAIIVFVSWYVLNIFFDNVVRPRMLKQSFDISFITVFLILLFWTYVLGPAGAILAIPLSLSLKLIYNSYIEKSNTIF